MPPTGLRLHLVLQPGGQRPGVARGVVAAQRLPTSLEQDGLGELGGASLLRVGHRLLAQGQRERVVLRVLDRAEERVETDLVSRVSKVSKVSTESMVGTVGNAGIGTSSSEHSVYMSTYAWQAHMVRTSSLERQTMKSGVRPRLRSSLTLCCVGLVFCSPGLGPTVGTMLTCTRQKFCARVRVR